MRIILASKSPRRREILSNVGVNFEVIESNFQEKFDDGMSPDDVVKYLAYKKAEDVAKNVYSEALVIGADTVVSLDSVIMGKPKNRQEAFDMLNRLSDRWHNVYTGICVINTLTDDHSIDFENTCVKIRKLSNDDINSYINTGEYVDKAGGYGIQGRGSLLVEQIKGCYFNVVGLPVYKLSCLLKEHGINLLKL